MSPAAADRPAMARQRPALQTLSRTADRPIAKAVKKGKEDHIDHRHNGEVAITLIGNRLPQRRCISPPLRDKGWMLQRERCFEQEDCREADQNREDGMTKGNCNRAWSLPDRRQNSRKHSRSCRQVKLICHASVVGDDNEVHAGKVARKPNLSCRRKTYSCITALRCRS